MSKVNLYCWLIALTLMICGSFYVKYVTQKFDAVKSELQTYKIENKQLKDNWEKEKQNVLAAGVRIQKLNKIIADNENSKLWSDTPIDLLVADELRKQYHNNKD